MFSGLERQFGYDKNPIVWTSGLGANIQENNIANVSAPTTITGNVAPNQYNIDLVGDYPSEVRVTLQDPTHGIDYTLPKVPEIDGLKFVGWEYRLKTGNWVDASNWKIPGTEITGDLEVHPKYMAEVTLQISLEISGEVVDIGKIANIAYGTTFGAIIDKVKGMFLTKVGEYVALGYGTWENKIYIALGQLVDLNARIEKTSVLFAKLFLKE
jgi:hypothetical protein